MGVGHTLGCALRSNATQRTPGVLAGDELARDLTEGVGGLPRQPTEDRPFFDFLDPRGDHKWLELRRLPPIVGFVGLGQAQHRKSGEKEQTSVLALLRHGWSRGVAPSRGWRIGQGEEVWNVMSSALST